MAMSAASNTRPDDDDDLDEGGDLTEAQLRRLAAMPDPAPAQVQAETRAQLDQYEADLRKALESHHKQLAAGE